VQVHLIGLGSRFAWRTYGTSFTGEVGTEVERAAVDEVARSSQGAIWLSQMAAERLADPFGFVRGENVGHDVDPLASGILGHEAR